MNHSPLKIVLLTPGAGQMYCGSCMSDNMLASTMMRQGHDVVMVPLYTPLTTDEPSASIDPLFFGGVNVYLQQNVALFRRVPRWMDRWLDHPGLVRKLAGRAVGLQAEPLGALTLSMVRGEQGRQRKEVKRLVDWLVRQPRPDVVNLSNLLIAGCVPAIRRQLGVPIVVTLQGDDLFLDALPEPARSQVLVELRHLADLVDRFIAHSDDYAERMADYFQIPASKIDVVPLGISLDGNSESPQNTAYEGVRTIGYMARLCPEKGLDLLIDAFLELKSKPRHAKTRLAVAGWRGPEDAEYVRLQESRIREAGWSSDWHDAGVLDRQEKQAFLGTLDVFSVPTRYREPKGRYVLEALARSVPVVQPRHGAFPEMLERTGGGRLFAPNDPHALASALDKLLSDDPVRVQVGHEGREGVERHASAEVASLALLEAYGRAIQDSSSAT